MVTSSLALPAMEVEALLRELNHRIENQFASAIELISAEAVRAEGREAKAALSNVVELLHGYADVHRSLLMPEYDALVDAAVHLRRLCGLMRSGLLDRLNIGLVFKSDSLPLEPRRCWRLGLILHELVTNVMKHACFDGRAGSIKIKLARTESLVNCVVWDNGSASTRGRHGRGQGLRIISHFAKGLGGRIEHGVGADFRSVVLAFPLTEREHRVKLTNTSRNIGSHRQAIIGSSARLRKAGTKLPDRSSHSNAAARAWHPGASPGYGAEATSPYRSTEALGQLSASHRMDAL